MDNNYRQCKRCGKFKKLIEFDLHKTKLGKSRSCKECLDKRKTIYKQSEEVREKHQKYYQDNIIRIREQKSNQRFIRKYNLSKKDVEEMIVSQDSKCKICEKPFVWDTSKKEKPCVDHDHKTGKVRGILCRKCNLQLTTVEDVDFCKKAIKYLGVKDIEDKELL